MEKIVLAVLSLLIWPVGFVLFLVTKNKKDRQLYLVLGIIGLIFFSGTLLR